MGVNAEPLAVEASMVFALLLYTTADADEGGDVIIFVPVIEGAGILERDDDLTRGIGVAPHAVTVDTDETVVEVIRAVIHKGDVADNDATRAVDVNGAKGIDGKRGETITIECRVHPVFLGDKESAIAGLNDASGHSGGINVLDDTRHLARSFGRPCALAVCLCAELNGRQYGPNNIGGDLHSIFSNVALLNCSSLRLQE